MYFSHHCWSADHVWYLVIWKVNHTVGCNTDVLKLVHATQTMYYSDLFVASYIPLVLLSESSQHFIISLLFTTKPRPLCSPPSLLFGCYCNLFLHRYQAGKLCVNGIMLKQTQMQFTFLHFFCSKNSWQLHQELFTLWTLQTNQQECDRHLM